MDRSSVGGAPGPLVKFLIHERQRRVRRYPVRVAALDFGQARVGLAVTDDLGLLAHPRPHLDGRELAGTLRALGELARAETWTRIIVGLPRNLDGSEGVAARRARRFAELVSRATGLPVMLLDERLSTREAHARLAAGGLDSKQAKTRVDSASAAILLQTWLDQRRARQAARGPGEPTQGDLR